MVSAIGQCEIHTNLDVDLQHGDGRRGVLLERAFEQDLMLARRDLAAVDSGDHQIPQIFVEHRRVGLEKRVRTAGGYQRVMEFKVIALPGFVVGMVASPLASLSRGGANIRELNSE